VPGHLERLVQLGERLEDEPPFGQPWMWDLETRLLDPVVAVEEQVEVDRPRPETRAGAIAAELQLDLLQPLEERARRELGSQHRGAVEESRLVVVSDGIGLAERGDSLDPDVFVGFEQLERATDRQLALTEVGAQADVGEWHPVATLAYMRRFGVLVALLLVASPAPAWAAPAASIPAGRALSGLSDYRFTLLGLAADPAAERLVADRGGTIVAPELHIWRLASTEAQRLIPRLARSGALRFAEADQPVFRQGHLAGGDPLAAPTIGWHLYRVGADRAEPPGPGIPVTIVDAGLDMGHMEFSARPNTILLNEQHVDLGGSDEYHGTIVASTAAAPTDGKGAVGIYPQAILRSFDLDFLSESSIVAGISRAVATGRSVINLSLGGDEPSRSIYEATINAFGRGSLVVAAAGNERQFDDPAIYPADFPHVLTVGSTNQTDLPSEFSSTSPAVDLAAPGEQIPWQYPADPAFSGTATGTSFAAPIVSAATAWVWTARSMLDKTQIFELMRAAAKDLSPPGPDNRTGLGLLDIPNALARAAPAIDPLEPNDDIDHVKAHGIFRLAAKPLTAPGRRRASYRARLHAYEDPHDVYRVWVPGRSSLTATIRPNANVNAVLWAPGTKQVGEQGAAGRRHLLTSSARPGGRPEIIRIENKTRRGYFAYLDVLLGRGVRSASYSFALRARALPSRPSTRR
jgi:subtilisin family serine protease